jgi:hypothetical protein
VCRNFEPGKSALRCRIEKRTVVRIWATAGAVSWPEDLPTFAYIHHAVIVSLYTAMVRVGLQRKAFKALLLQVFMWAYYV